MGVHNPPIVAYSFFLSYFFLLGRWVKAEAAAVLLSLLDLGLRSVLEAAEAARLLVTSLFLFLAMQFTSFRDVQSKPIASTAQIPLN